MKKGPWLLWFILLIGLSDALGARQTDSLVRVQKGQFFRNGKPYYFIGANYWYGGVTCMTAAGRARVDKELAFLKAHGVTQVRVLAGGEGKGLINGMWRVDPPYQQPQGVFHDDVLVGLDHLLLLVRKHGMTATLFLSNNWDWSGGFLQYLNWNGLLADSVMNRKLTWDENQDIVSRFYTCTPCKEAYRKQLVNIVGRTNSITGIRYANDPAIMAWELANEPRPMRPAAINDFVAWVEASAKTIKQLDPYHLVTTGSEGEMGSETLAVFQRVHALPQIDFATIHIWPKNWHWLADTAVHQSLPEIIRRSNAYIGSHLSITRQLQKPLVVEEFGLPRDGHQFDPAAAVAGRNQYFKSVFDWVGPFSANTKGVAGATFWAYSGMGRPIPNQVFWQPGDPFLGDPPQEEQGLNSVFDADRTTWQLIQQYTQKWQ